MSEQILSSTLMRMKAMLPDGVTEVNNNVTQNSNDVKIDDGRILDPPIVSCHCLQQRKEIKRLEDMLKNEQQRNDILECRMTKLENTLEELLREDKLPEKLQLLQNEVCKIYEVVQQQEENAESTQTDNSTSNSLCSDEPPFAHDRVAMVQNSKPSYSDLSYFQKAQLYLNDQLDSNFHRTSKETSSMVASSYFPSETLIKRKNDVMHVLEEKPIPMKIRQTQKSQYKMFYTKTPGYRIELRAQLERGNSKIFFSLRAMKGAFDDQLDWPFVGKFKIQVLPEDVRDNKENEVWIIPSAEHGNWEKGTERCLKGCNAFSAWVGPFDVSNYVERKFYLLIKPCDNNNDHNLSNQNNVIHGPSVDISSICGEPKVYSETLIKRKNDVKHVLQKKPIPIKIRKIQREGEKLPLHHCKSFYTKTPGYRMQIIAQCEREDGKIYFAICMLKGVFDNELKWPFVGQFKIQAPPTKGRKGREVWVIPSPDHGNWEKGTENPSTRGKRQKGSSMYSEWVGPFDVSSYVEKDFYLLVKPFDSSNDDSSNPDIMHGPSVDISTMFGEPQVYSEAAVGITEYVLQGSKLTWKVTKKKRTPLPKYHSKVFYTKIPGYKLQLCAKMQREDGSMYFSISMLKGDFDDELDWPFVGQFKIQIDPQHTRNREVWMIPSSESGVWEIGVEKPTSFEKRKRASRVYSEWIGPFDVSDYVGRKFYLLAEFVDDELD